MKELGVRNGVRSGAEDQPPVEDEITIQQRRASTKVATSSNSQSSERIAELHSQIYPRRKESRLSRPQVSNIDGKQKSTEYKIRASQ